MVKVGVVLCGCGRFDGSEVHESVLTLLHLARGGAEWVGLAPDTAQWAVCEHFGGEVQAGEDRNQLQEAARIARGEVAPLAQVSAADLDALILPGGSGAARNLCDFAERGGDGAVLPELATLLRSLHAARKPIGAICIAPAILALALGPHRPRLTLGPSSSGPALEAARTGAEMVDCPVDGVVVDEAQRLVSTPAYLRGPGIAEVDAGIGKLVAQVLAWCRR
ncbi:MAG: isoprenoid biosynthesis glyoxalase ElbB [Planctomycetes bacterium]|nr:isoprenoid biosynthesis glyoxalase ElbB [Planctomycetota bacterium]